MVEKIEDSSIFNRLIILALAAFLSPLLLQITGSAIFKVIDDCFFFLLLLDTFTAIRIKKIKLHFDKTCLLVTLVFTLYILTEAVFGLINNNHFMAVILELRLYKYLFLFVILLYYNSEDVYYNIYRIARVIAYVSIPVSVYQRLTINIATGDVITGLYGDNGSGIMTLSLLILYFAEFSKNLSTNKRIIGWDLLYFIPIAINETKISFILIPILFLVSVMLAGKNILKSLVSSLLILAVLIPALNYFYYKVNSRNVWDFFEAEELDIYMNQQNESDMGRFLKIQKGYEIISTTYLNTVVGYGIGAAYVGRGTGTFGQIVEEYNNDKMLFGGTRAQLFDSMLETGLLGIFIQVAFIIVILIRIITSPKIEASYYYIAVISLIIWLFTLFYDAIITHSNLFFLMISAIYMTCIKLAEDKNAAALNRRFYY